MKYFFMCLVALNFSTSVTFSQWMPINSPTQNNLHCVQVVDSLISYIGGDGGKVYKTLDGGENWFDLSPQSSIDWYCMSFVDANHGWVGGRQGTIARTTNGGSSWEINTVYSSSNINVIESMYFYNNNIGYITGGIFNNSDRQTYIYKTTNGGQSWNQQVYLSGGVFLEMSFVDQNNGYVVGTQGGVYKTNNGGITWDPYFVNTLYWLRSAYFFDSQSGVVLGQSGLAWRTSDGGINWNSVNSTVSDWIESVSFIDKYSGWAVGGSGLCIYTFDSGNNWVSSQLPTNNYLWAINFKDSTGMIVGNNGTIFKSSFVKSLNIIQPNGGEILQPNYYYQIKWNKSLINKVYLDYSTDNGTTWNIIDIDLPSTLYNWFVPNINSSQCRIRLTSVDDPTYFVISDSNFTINGTVGILPEELLPTDYNLFQNYPNPFNPSCKVRFALPNASYVILTILNSLGEEISEIVNEYLNAGIHEYEFDGKNLTSGIYFYTLKTERYSLTKKMILLK